MISIIMAAYNASLTIKESIESIINQTYKNWELIIVNDCSTDDTVTIVTKYCENDSRIKLINNEVNLKVSKTRNEGIKNSIYRYIAFLDSDDLWHKEKLEKQLIFMQENKAFFSSTDYEIIDVKSNRLMKKVYAKTKDYKQLLRGNSIGTSTVMIDTNFIKEIKFKDIRVEDYELWLSLLMKYQTKVYAINETLAYYRVSGNSLSSNKAKSVMWTWNMFRKEQKKNFFTTILLMVYYAVNSLTKVKKLKN